MTDTLSPLMDTGEVNTTNPIIDALRLPFNAEIAANVQRFGFEYEMFDGDDGEDDYDEDWYEVETDDVYCHDTDRYTGQHTECNCDDCIERRISIRQEEVDRERDERQTNRAGHNAIDLMARAFDAGLTSDKSMCEYHCRCSMCRHTRSYPLLTAQEDGTCGVEFVSRILDLRDFADAERDIAKWVDVMNEWKDDGNWMPDGYTSNGNHIHVSKQGDVTPFDYDVITRSQNHINALFSVFDWSIADGGCGQIRGYNHKPGHGRGGSWLSDRGYGTHEIRMWNTPYIPERLWAHLGISVGLVRWAFALATALPDFDFASVTHDSYYGTTRRTINDETYATIHAHRDLIVDGISRYIPDNACFDGARALILSLS